MYINHKNHSLPYVVGGSEQFKKIPNSTYPEIGTKKRPVVKKTYSHIKPGQHNAQYASSQSRWRTVADEINRPIQIYIVVNGDVQNSPLKMLLPSKLLKGSWDRILEFITDRVGIKLNKAVRRLHTINGDPIYDVKGLSSGGTYVACGSEKFKRQHYRTGGMTYSAPVLKRKPLPPINRRPRKENLSQDLKIKAVMVKARGEDEELVEASRSNVNSVQSEKMAQAVVPPIKAPVQEIFQGKPVRVAKPIPAVVSAEEATFKPNTKVRPKYLDAVIKSQEVEEDKNVNRETPIEKQLDESITVEQPEQEMKLLNSVVHAENEDDEEDDDDKLSVKSEGNPNILEIKNDLENFSPRTVDSHITEVTNEDANITNRASIENVLDDIDEDEKMSVQRTVRLWVGS